MAEKEKKKKTAAKSTTTRGKATRTKATKSTKTKAAKTKAAKTKAAKTKAAKSTRAKSSGPKTAASRKKTSAAKKSAGKSTKTTKAGKSKTSKAKSSKKTKAKKETKPKVKGTAAAAPKKRRKTKRKSKKDIKTLRRKSGKLVEEDKIAGVGDKTVQSKTGNTWSDWFKIIDKAGGKDMDHRSIARYLYDSFPDLSSWWSQMITVGYERTRGKRDKYQRSEGYAVNASKTISAPVNAVYSAWTSAPKRKKWLPNVKFKVSTKHENKTLRIEWKDKKTRVDVHFYERGMGKSQITVQHRKLPDAEKADQMRTYWRERLAVLASQMREV